MKSVFFAVCILFLLNGHVESRRHRDEDRKHKSYLLFVFGDSFVSNGFPIIDRLSFWTRNWYEPYGSSYSDNNYRPTGRFSDGKVQSDFIANLMGHDKSPPTEGDDPNQSFGVNFAEGLGPANGNDTENLATQIGELEGLLDHGMLDLSRGEPVALVAFSGIDYSDIPDKETHPRRFVDYIENVTDSIAAGVLDLHEGLGMSKVMVNLMQPMGCSPRYTRGTTNYTECVDDGITDLHNKKLKEKLGSKRFVLLLDLHEAFVRIIHPKKGSGFLHRHIPCCESTRTDGYCGQVSRVRKPLYTVCDNPEDYFYFDEWHPTEAGWKAVMEYLKDDIKEFLQL